MVTKLYTLFLGLLVALFVGVGIAALYPGPTAPEPPAVLSKPAVAPGATESADSIRQQNDFQQAQDNYQANLKTYDRNVSIMALAAAVLLLGLGLTVFKAVPLMDDSLTLGAVFILIYSIVRGFSNDNSFRFLVVSVGLAMASWLGYVRFVRPAKPRKRAR